MCLTITESDIPQRNCNSCFTIRVVYELPAHHSYCKLPNQTFPFFITNQTSVFFKAASYPAK